MRPRLVAIAPGAAEVVRFAGGWLFDQVMAGWEVTVLTGDGADGRALRILGARAGDLETALAAPAQRPWPQAMAVQAELYYSDPRVRRLVTGAFCGGQTEVRLWGYPWDAEPDGGELGSVQHRLSVAARAFKAQALAAAAAPADPGEVTEVFRKGELPRSARRAASPLQAVN